jgi:hypothetical protein
VKKLNGVTNEDSFSCLAEVRSGNTRRNIRISAVKCQASANGEDIDGITHGIHEKHPSSASSDENLEQLAASHGHHVTLAYTCLATRVCDTAANTG